MNSEIDFTPPSPEETARWAAEEAAARLAQARTPISDAYRAFVFLREHPLRGYLDSSFIDVLDFDLVRVDPATERIEDEAGRNTATRVWLESGLGQTEPEGEIPGGIPYHDPSLDCGGPDFESALIQLAVNVRAQYGPSLPTGLADALASSVDPDWPRDQRALD